MKEPTPGLIIAAPRSGGGKTTVTLALLAAIRRRGVKVRAAKSGPDYIDPAFHASATGWPSHNLDSWAMTPDHLADVAGMAMQDADILIVESSMGLFDGVSGLSGRTGAGADIAGALGLPVLLVLDISGQSQTAAAIARGFQSHDPRVRIGGVILNRVASERHRAGAAEAMAAIGMPVLGAILRDNAIMLPERHLGLVQASEHVGLEARLDRLADLAERSLDLDAILALAQMTPPQSLAGARPCLPPPGQRVALAWDAAFSFVYAHLSEGWRRAGAELVPFSPLGDEAPPKDCDSCWLPGGYPELHAGQLAGAIHFRRGLTAFAQTRPVHGECGGYMVLGAAIETADGARHAMTGLLDHATSFARRKMNLGYRQAELLHDSPLGAAGSIIRGHEFHYSQVIDPGTDEPLASLSDATGRPLGISGGRRGHVSGAFFHAIAAADLQSR
ncbi:MAG: cobyrinate a,c-diamide synthase [Caulobacteraceae bacterium]